MAGVALAGGGPLGAFFELGTLQALAEGIDGLDLCRLDAYAGVSSGSLLAAGLANGLTPLDMGRIIISEDSGDSLANPGLFMQPAWQEYGRRLARLPQLALNALLEYARSPLSHSLAEVLDPLAAVLPAGLLDNQPLEKFLRELYSRGGRTNDFRELACKLFIVATDLNTGSAARFGEPGSDHVPISLAIQASTALPGLYPPVTIDGETYVDGALLRTMHASLVLDAGADLVFCINPLVAFDATEGGRHRRETNLTEHGLPIVLGQTFRSLIQSRMVVGMAAYKDRYPRADILLFEPDRGDREMFFANVFRYADRQRLVDHAYQCARRDLLRRARVIAPVLERHGLRLRPAVLKDKSRSFHLALRRQHQANRRVVQSLSHTLDRLETLVTDARR